MGRHPERSRRVEAGRGFIEGKVLEVKKLDR